MFNLSVIFAIINCGCFTTNSDSGEKAQIHHVGYIDLEDPHVENFNVKRCADENRFPINFYHSSAPEIYKDSKYSFRKTINKKISTAPDKFSGLLSFRFLINCNGKVVCIESRALDFDFNEVEFPDGFREECVNFITDENNWNVDSRGDFYMYLLLRYEEGKLSAIIP